MRIHGKPQANRSVVVAGAAVTLIELLVVIAIIAILAALLMPALERARDAAVVAVCGGHQRQMYHGFNLYGGDYAEYPTNYARYWESEPSETYVPPSWNWGDECAGRMFGRPPSQVSWAYHTPPYYEPANNIDVDGWPSWATGAGHHLISGGYLPYRRPKPGEWPPAYNTDPEPYASEVFYCTGNCPTGWEWGGRTGGVYVYNGPHSHAKTISNNSAKSGLRFLGRHHEGEPWGPSYRHRPEVFGAGEIAMLGCPSVYQKDDKLVREPHGQRSALDYTDKGYGNGQDDWGWGNYFDLHYDRNYLYGDGHVRYVSADRREGIP